MKKAEALAALATAIKDDCEFVLEKFRGDGDPRWMGVMVSMLRGHKVMLDEVGAWNEAD